LAGLRLYKGAAGIAYFLVDYYRTIGDQQALDLAGEGLRWAVDPARETRLLDLGAGRAGIGTACLNYADAGGVAWPLEQAVEIGEELLAHDPGPVLEFLPDRADDRATDIFRGAAGEGLYLLRLHEATGDDRYLQGAIRNAAWLDEAAIRDRPGCYWTIYTSLLSEPPPISRYFGYCHGAAGIGYFIAALYQQNQDPQWTALILDIALLFAEHAVRVSAGNNWPMRIGEADADLYQWCHGLAGNGELFIELFDLTQNTNWHQRALEFARLIAPYRLQSPAGYDWQSDESGLTSPSYSNGAAGIAHFLLRLREPNRFRPPFG
jgi:lantibiotic modifying enzyme